MYTLRMHKVLRIHEIIGLIARNLPPKEQCKMALLCRTFYEPTMDELWHTMESIGPLILCLPREVAVFDYDVDMIRIKRSPKLHEWDRLKHHARRVRVLLTGPHDVLLPDSCRLLEEAYPDPHILPNLRRLHLGDETCAKGTTMFFIRPSLQHIRYQIPPTHDRDWYLDGIGKNSPNLRVLALAHIGTCNCVSETGHCVFHRPQAAKALSRVIHSFRSLTDIRFSAYFSHDAIKHLCTLPHLATLGLYLGDTNCKPLVSAYGDTPFRALSTLEVSGRDTSELALWLRAVRLPSLTTLSVSVSMLPTISAAEDLVASLSYFSSLVHLYIRIEMTAKGAAALKYPTDETILKPLYEKLPLVSDFTLSGLPCNPLRKTILAMALRWPHLKTLRLHRTCYARHPQSPSSGSISLRDLLLLARHCPSIETIAVPLARRLRSSTPSVYDEDDFKDESVTVDMTSGLIVPLSLANQDLYQSVPLDSACISDIVKQTPLPVSNLRNLELRETFLYSDLRNVAKYLAEVFPHAQFVLNPHRRQPLLADCAETIMDLKKAYNQGNQLRLLDAISTAWESGNMFSF